MRININVSEDLLKRVDARAKSMYISRSAYIATALVQKMQTDDAMEMMPQMAATMQEALKYAKEGKDMGLALKAVEENTGA